MTGGCDIGAVDDGFSEALPIQRTVRLISAIALGGRGCIFFVERPHYSVVMSGDNGLQVRSGGISQFHVPLVEDFP